MRLVSALAALTLLSATLALAQSASQQGTRDSAKQVTDNWSDAAALVPLHKTLILVAAADPTRRHRCFVQSITADQLLCIGALRRTHGYAPQDVAALILPDAKIRGASKVMTIAEVSIVAAMGLTITCPLCAVVTGATALVSLAIADVLIFVNYRLETLLYLAPGQTLQVKFHHPSAR